MIIDKKFYKYILSLSIVSSLSLFHNSCADKISGSEVTNEDAVCLVGKVLDQRGEGVPNIVARLDKIKLSDTTDTKGNYTLRLSKQEMIDLHINLDTLKDSVKIINSGSIASSIQITKWIDTLPSVYLIQRNIYGKLQTEETDSKRIEAVISILNSDSSVKHEITKELWFNNGTKGFSGFCYFPKNSNNQKYSVYIKVFNKDSIYTGKSQIIYFNDIAGDIEIPDFDPFLNPSLMISAGNDTTLSINDTLVLSASVVNNQTSIINKWEWNINGQGFVQTSNSDTILILPGDPSDFTCVVKATDIDKNIAIDTIIVNCIQDIPTIYFLVPFGIARNKQTEIQAYTTDLGKIQKWEWYIGGIEYQETDTTFDRFPSSSITFTSPNEFTTILCSLKVTDEDGNTKSDTVSISLGTWKNVSSIINNSYPVAFYQKDGLCVWGENYYTTKSMVRFCKSNYSQIDTIGNFEQAIHVYDQISSCISQDSSIYVAFTEGDQNDLHIELHKYKNSNWEQIPVENLAEGELTSLSMECLGNDVFIGVTQNKNQHILYKYDGSKLTTINIDQSNVLDHLLITRSSQNSIYICGNYSGSNDSSRYFLKEYTYGALKDISTGLRIDGTLVSMIDYNNEIIFGTAKDVSYVMHSGIFDSYLCRYNNNSIERFGGYLGRGSHSKLNLIYQTKGKLYAIDSENQSFVLE